MHQDSCTYSSSSYSTSKRNNICSNNNICSCELPKYLCTFWSCKFQKKTKTKKHLQQQQQSREPQQSTREPRWPCCSSPLSSHTATASTAWSGRLGMTAMATNFESSYCAVTVCHVSWSFGSSCNLLVLKWGHSVYPCMSMHLHAAFVYPCMSMHIQGHLVYPCISMQSVSGPPNNRFGPPSVTG